jgi:hypothetical protein
MKSARFLSAGSVERRVERRLAALLAPLAVLALGASVASCGNDDFDPAPLVNTVRILASRASAPYARPGEKVEVEVLAYDGRPDRSRAMKIYWLPFPCINPPLDAYYACFTQLGGPADGGADGGAGAPNPLALLKPGIDLSPYLPTGPKFELTMPANAVTSHPKVNGVREPYGVAILFNIACAGHIELVERDPSNPQSVPFGCFDDATKERLGPSDYVIGITRVYAYDSRRNDNPVISGVSYDGKPVDLREGITIDKCEKEKKDECPEKNIDVQVPETSQEAFPSDSEEDPGGTRREQIFVAYFATAARFGGGARLLYEPTRGKVTGTEDKLLGPKAAGEGLLWAVVHDNRGGATWVEIPVHAR